jgi:hypothetical protein
MFQQSVHILKNMLPLVKTAGKRIIAFTHALDQAMNEADNALFSDMNEEDIMTPFVLGSLNARYSEEERQQWSKLDCFANGLLTPPTVKSKAPSITMSSTMFVPTTSYYGHHSAITDTNMFSQPSSSTSSSSSQLHDRFQYSTTSVNTNNKLNYQQTAPSDLNPSDLVAFVAQMQDNPTQSLTSSPASNNNNNNNKGWSNNSTPVMIDESTSAPNTTSIVASDNENLLYSLLSNQRTTASPQVTAKRQYQSSYMNVGLGIYASAHQHHNDVIRQHLPANNKPSSSSFQQ